MLWWVAIQIGEKKKREVKRRRHLVISPCFWLLTFTSVLVFQWVWPHLVVRAVKMGRPNMPTEWSRPLVQLEDNHNLAPNGAELVHVLHLEFHHTCHQQFDLAFMFKNIKIFLNTFFSVPLFLCESIFYSAGDSTIFVFCGYSALGFCIKKLACFCDLILIFLHQCCY